MSDTLRPVSVQKVSAVLRKAGYVRGPHRWSSGPGVFLQHDDSVKVIYLRHYSEPVDVTPERLAAYRTAIEASGIVCVHADTHIICTGITES